MKRTIGISAAAILFVGTLGSSTALAAPSASSQHPGTTEVTGCLQQGPAAKEYLLQTSDGTIWGINETDMLMNNYLGHTVTISGDQIRPTASERNAGGAHHFLKAMDVVVDSESCQK
jgi:hypothetical protein